MRQLLRLLLYLAAGALFQAPSSQSIYFESAPSCGYTQQGFVHFEQSPELLQEPALGVCGWSFDGVERLQPRVDLCVSCSFTPAGQSCQRGTTAVRQPVWHLASSEDCNWAGCFLSNGTCSNGTAESSGVCEDGNINLKCCPFKRYVRCCKMESCTRRSSPAGQCVVGEKDLLPGQQYVGRVFVVPSASTDCHTYSFDTTRICSANRAFAEEVVYDACEPRPVVSRDTDGCAKLPGYNFYSGWLLADAANWSFDDGTQWSKVTDPNYALSLAARDMPLMAGRCSASESCAAFQNDGNSTKLLYQLPERRFWVKVNVTDKTRCYGIYEKTPPRTSCPRLGGYLFIPMLTLETNSSAAYALVAGGKTCADCANSNAVAVRCDAYGSSCAGFSNYHGLIAGSSGLLSDQPMTQFTTTPCAGTFVRAGKVFPQEVEQLDRLLCGELVYCSSQLRYHASGQASSVGSSSYYVDLSVDILTDLSLPRGLLDASGGGLRQLPSVRSLTIRCLQGSALLGGGLPVGLVTIMPLLQELRVLDCRTGGTLPRELAQLRYLRVLDLSQNSLTGELPADWASMKLAYLNISHNLLTGAVPAAWRNILEAVGEAPPPPPARMAPPPQQLSPWTEALESRKRMLVADLSSNYLGGILDRVYIYDTCVRKELRIQLHGAPRTDLLAALGNGSRPTFLLHYNPGITEWSGHFMYAVADLGSSFGRGGDNLCGAIGYKVTLGLMWGIFSVAFLALLVWTARAACTAALAARRSKFDIPVLDEDPPSSPDPSPKLTTVTSGSAEALDVKLPRTFFGRLTAVVSRLWGKRWVRRVTLLLRVGYLLADVAMDIRVIVWLFQYGDVTSSAVCLAFLVVTQAAVSVALVASLSHHFFASHAFTVMISPLLVAAGPLIGPVLAIANLRNSDVPLVFWRYLELVEFSVALLQAPAESVTQSIVYARHNLMGNAVYLDHAIFIASIILSLGDMLLVAYKLCRYKRGPLRRVVIAVTHLDKVRDPLDYRARVFGNSPDAGIRFLEAPLNPARSIGGVVDIFSAISSSSDPLQAFEPRRSATVPMGLGPLVLPPMGLAGVGSVIAGTSPATDRGYAPPLGDAVNAGPSQPDVASGASTSPPTAHTFTPLTAPRYRPSLLATSAQRLGGNGAGPYYVTTNPSRLGSGGNARATSVTIPSHPPLRPLLASLPPPPATVHRTSTSKDEVVAAWDALASPTADWVQAGDAERAGQAAAAPGGSSGRSDGLSKPSSSLTSAAQPMLPATETARTALMGSLSSDMYGLAGSSGHGPPLLPSVAPAPGLGATPRCSTGEMPAAVRSNSMSSTTGSSSNNSIHSAGAGPRLSGPRARTVSGCGASAATSSASGSVPPTVSAPPSYPDDSRYLASAAIAVEAALAQDAAAASSSGGSIGRGPAAPAGLVLSPGRASGSGYAPGAAPGSHRPESPYLPTGPAGSLHRLPGLAAMRSANVSPARRREVPSLSIAVPANSVHGGGIEVIRIMTPSNAKHLSPSASRGASTSVATLPPLPPRPPQVGEPPRQQHEG